MIEYRLAAADVDQIVTEEKGGVSREVLHKAPDEVSYLGLARSKHL